MEHCGTQVLETDRLLLRRFTADDAEAMYKNWASDLEVTKYLTWPAHESVSVSRAVLDGWVSAYEHENTYQWAIVLKNESMEPVGSIGVVHQEERISMASIGYCIGRKWWNQGITSEALSAVMDFLFDTVGFNRIEARHDLLNYNSGRVMKKCGMRYEGTMRAADLNNQGICDACYYALLKTDR
ncbi:MAG: GNAT family N-acetyltransferase [Lacrimispora sp.]|uniref:GNAT family N-acetyltransferase n=1 Tax=Lacrimispora sp. TaxID=2719234 RepID=UPI0039E317A5